MIMRRCAVNVTRVAEYIAERADGGTPQFVVISLKDNFYDKAQVKPLTVAALPSPTPCNHEHSASGSVRTWQGLVGIYRDRREECSKTVTLSLDGLDEETAQVADE